ncbi:MAG: hypothetical protein H0X69_17140 [Gemmatimonadales bacterium]|nr:hypothetical protein [Gemmatimonadales bacterium]
MSFLGHLSLRPTLLIDAIASGTSGLLLLVAARPLAELFDLPAALLRASGASMVPFIAFLVVLATRDVVSHLAVKLVVAFNLAWVAASVLLLVSGWVDPNGLGYAFVIAQAAAVALFAQLQATALSRESRSDEPDAVLA